jgi:hypothetical protein
VCGHKQAAAAGGAAALFCHALATLLASDVPIFATSITQNDALTPGEARLAQELQDIANLPAPRPRSSDDEPLLSTGRHATHHTMGALASPSEEPGGLNSLYTFLTSATPQGVQHAQQQGQQQVQVQMQQLESSRQPQRQQVPLSLERVLTAPHCVALPHVPFGAVPTQAPAPPSTLGQGLWGLPGAGEQVQHVGTYGVVAHVHVASTCHFEGATVSNSGTEQQQQHSSKATGACTLRSGAVPPSITSSPSSSPDVPASTSSTTPLDSGDNGCGAAVPSGVLPINGSVPLVHVCGPPAAAPMQQWGPEELRQLLELLGDQQAAHGQGVVHGLRPSLPPGQLSPIGAAASVWGPPACQIECASSSGTDEEADQVSTTYNAHTTLPQPHAPSCLPMPTAAVSALPAWHASLTTFRGGCE